MSGSVWPAANWSDRPGGPRGRRKRRARAYDHHTRPGGNGWAELLTLVGSVRRLAFDRTLPPSEALGRIRDAYHDYDQQGACSDGSLSHRQPPPGCVGDLGAFLCAL
jgi:hypothetical protein